MNTLYTFLLASMTAITVSCNPSSTPSPEPGPDPVATFAKGADISWVTEMEDKDYKFYDGTGKAMECTALLKSIGFNAVRYRVWVNPASGWNGKEDVLVKAKRAQALGMDIMIDFHYSDNWADPAKQYPPDAWSKYTVVQMADAVSSHTTEVLKYLKDNGITVKWVQVGNEVTNGMLWESGRVSGKEAANFVKYFNAGRDAAKAVYPAADVVLHVDNGWNISTLTWFYSLVESAGIEYDTIGLSLYPSYWDDASSSFLDWNAKTKQFVSNLSTLHKTYGKPIMLTEFGMPASWPDQTAEALQYIIDHTADYSWFGGIFYWEPESEQSRNGYSYGAFSGGVPTAALKPFAN